MSYSISLISRDATRRLKLVDSETGTVVAVIQSVDLSIGAHDDLVPIKITGLVTSDGVPLLAEMMVAAKP